MRDDQRLAQSERLGLGVDQSVRLRVAERLCECVRLPIHLETPAQTTVQAKLLVVDELLVLLLLFTLLLLLSVTVFVLQE